MPYGGLEFVFLIIPLALLVGSVGGLIILWVFVFRGRRGKAGGLSTCGACGYAIKGVSTFDCPECGADLRDVGIVSPRQKGRVNPVLFLLLWTVFLPVPACISSVVAMLNGPQVSRHNSTISMTPQSGQYQQIDIYCESMAGPAQLDTASLMINGGPQGAVWTMVDLQTMQHDLNHHIAGSWAGFLWGSLGGNMSVRGVLLDKQEMLSFLQQAGAAPNDPQVDVEADELVQILQAAHAGGLPAAAGVQHFTNVQQHSSSYDTPWWGTFFIMLGLWILLWVGGVVLFFRLRRPAREPAPG